MVEFKAPIEGKLVRKKMFYFTRKTQFYMGYITFNEAQYGHQLLPYKCLFCVQLPPIHEKESLA
jgi:hypothetical protein